MKLIIDLTSGNVSARVRQELSICLTQIIHYVALEKDDIIEQIQKIKNVLNQLNSYINKEEQINKNIDKIQNEFSKQ